MIWDATYYITFEQGKAWKDNKSTTVCIYGFTHYDPDQQKRT